MPSFVKVYQYPHDKAILDRRLLQVAEPDAIIETTVRSILQKVRRDGLKAVLAYTRKFDQIPMLADEVQVPEERLKEAWEKQPASLKHAMTVAKKRIEAFHKKQRRRGWSFTDETGTTLSQRVLPLQSVGIYIPGGLAAYPSTVLMNSVPAFVAGVKRVVAVTSPLRGRSANEVILAAAYLAGVRELYQIGGAQAVAALAYGADPIPAVDKVVGPGNAYVQTAKRLLYGTIDIDMVAGPTEALIVADSSAPPAYVAADLLSQAEHETGTSVWAILIGKYDVDALLNEITRQTKTAPRREIIQASLKNNGAIVQVETAQEAADLANQRAPEHISLMTRQAESLAKKIHSSGAIFIGNWSPESVGDYVAGPNHVLPTGRSARFFSPLSVDDFVRTDHVVKLTREALKELSAATIAMAEAEGLFAHAQAVRERFARS